MLNVGKSWFRRRGHGHNLFGTNTPSITGEAPFRQANGQMRNRIDQTFAELLVKQAKAFIPYICAGDPNLSATVDLGLALAGAGCDILELGLPFSDPLADGIVNQLAAQRALEAGEIGRAHV